MKKDNVKKKRIDPVMLRTKYAKAKVKIEHDGNYTVAVVSYRKKTVIGISKRNPNADPLIPERGEEIAIIRALRKLETP